MTIGCQDSTCPGKVREFDNIIVISWTRRTTILITNINLAWNVVSNYNDFAKRTGRRRSVGRKKKCISYVEILNNINIYIRRRFDIYNRYANFETQLNSSGPAVRTRSMTNKKFVLSYVVFLLIHAHILPPVDIPTMSVILTTWCLFDMKFYCYTRLLGGLV